MADGVEAAVEQNTTGPKRASGDSGSVEQHSLQDQIAVDRYLPVKRAVPERHVRPICAVLGWRVRGWWQGTLCSGGPWSPGRRGLSSPSRSA